MIGWRNYSLRASDASESRERSGAGVPASERVGGGGGAKPPAFSRERSGAGVPASERVGGGGGAKPPAF